MVEVVNVVASGELGLQLDLERLAADLPELDSVEEAVEQRGTGHRLVIQLPSHSYTAIMTRKGTCILTGGDSIGELDSAATTVGDALRSLDDDLFSDVDVVEAVEVQNVVCTADLERDLNLNAVSVHLGLEEVEYNPQEFGGVVYRPEEIDATLLVFRQGSVVVNGVTTVDAAESALDFLRGRLEEMAELEVG